MASGSGGGVYEFEAIGGTLEFIPLAGRRALDALGRKLSLDGWLSLSIEDRRALVHAGAGDEAVSGEARSAVGRANPAAPAIDPTAEPDPERPPADLLDALGPNHPLPDSRWRALRPLDRYALVKCAAKAEKLVRAYDEILGPVPMPHLSESGTAHMVDVAAKSATPRRAVASACVRTTPRVVRAVAEGALAKGDALAVARIAGIMAAKRTPDLIPLCHSVQMTHAAVEFELDAEGGEIRVQATAEAVDRTGVEMEAMVAAAVASLTLYDMLKGADRWATIESVRLEQKSGGKSGDVRRAGEGSK